MRSLPRTRLRSPASCSSSSDLAHRPRRADESGFVDAVLQLLVLHGPAQKSRQIVVGGSPPQWAFEVPLPAREEAGAQLSVRRQPDAVTAGAEGLRHGVDEPDLAGA